METGVVWELVTPAGSLVFDPFGIESRLALTRIDGMAGAELRASVANIPQSDGAIVFTAFRGARYPILEGYVKTFNDLSARRLALDQIVAYTDSIRNADGTLRFTPTGAPMRELSVRLYERVQVSSGEGVLKEFQISLVAADPRVYSSQLHTAEALLSAGADIGGSPPARSVDLSVQNAGTTSSPPILRIDGPCVNPLVYCYEIDQGLAFTGLTLPAADFIYIDCGRELIVRNATAESLIGYLNIPASDFFALPLGSSTLALSASTTGWTAATKLVVNWRDAFI